VFRGHHRKVRILLGLSDILIIAVAFELAYWARQRLDYNHFLFVGFHNQFYILEPVRAFLLLWSIAVWVLLGFWWRIYDRIQGAHPRVILADAFRQSLAGTASIVLFQYLQRLELSRTFLFLFGIVAWVLLCLFRLHSGRLFAAIRGRFGAANYVVVVGAGTAAQRIGRQLEQASVWGVRLLSFIADSPDQTANEVKLAGTYPVRPLDALTGMLREHVIDEIIFAVDSRRLAELEEVFLQCDEEGVRTRVAVDFMPHVNSQVFLDRLGASPLLTFSATPHDEIRLLIKRIIDIALAGAALVLIAPFMLVIGALVRLTSPGPAIFRQIRCGLNGRRFVFYKFRSMCEGADQMRSSLAHLSERETAIKIKDDPRLTPLGRLLRRFSIDEWPQLWNVLKGDMSLVGPRPAIPEEVEQYKRWQRRRLRMRPGLTSLWAVSGRDSVDFETWMKLDMQYIDTWSLALDWKIILLTIPQVLSGKGAH